MFVYPHVGHVILPDPPPDAWKEGEGFAWSALDTVLRSKPQLSQNIDPGGTGELQFGQFVMDIE